MPAPDEHLYSPPLRLFAILRYLVPAAVTLGVGINTVALGISEVSFFLGLAAVYFGFLLGFYYRDRLDGRDADVLVVVTARAGNPDYSNDIADWLHLGFTVLLVASPYVWLFTRL
jgi:hypothetical protein